MFGPHPRDYRKAIPRRMRRLALKCVLSDKARQAKLICLDSMDAVDGKTKSMVDLLQKLDISGSILKVTRDAEEKVVRAAHNLAKVWTLPVTLLNANELLRRETLIMTVAAARWAEEFLASAPRRGRGTRGEVTVAVEDQPADEIVANEPEALEDLPDEEGAGAEEQPAPEDVIDEAEASVADAEEDQDSAEEQAAPEDGTADTEQSVDLSVEHSEEGVDGTEEEKE